jgi:hypothetical protein
LRHGFSLALNALTAKAAGGSPESKKFAADLAAFTQQPGIQKSGHYFMCSFSSCGDDLGQWRAYADKGRGYALGFDAKALEDAFDKQAGAPILKVFPIAYDDAQLIAIHRQIVDGIFDLISLPCGKSLQPAAIKALQAELSTLFMVHAMHAGPEPSRIIRSFGWGAFSYCSRILGSRGPSSFASSRATMNRVDDLSFSAGPFSVAPSRTRRSIAWLRCDRGVACCSSTHAATNYRHALGACLSQIANSS